MMNIEKKYKDLCETPSDINEHLPTLHDLAGQCQHVTELGVRGVISSWALLRGLPEGGTLFMNDITSCDVSEIQHVAKTEKNVDITFVEGDDLKIDTPTETDMTFIDTWHVYGHLKRELARYAPITKKFLVMHDTTVDADQGETVRCHWDAEHQSTATGIPVDEITKGLWPAIEEFLAENVGTWELINRYTNNNGLTVIKRID
jgi:hypothetical protein